MVTNEEEIGLNHTSLIFTKMPNFKYMLSLTLLAIILSLSSGVSSWFDGLPWTNAVETLAAIIIIPGLVIIGRHFLQTKPSVIFLITLLVLKLTLHFGAPLSGWKVKVSPDLQGLENGEFIRTYFTIWQEGVSAIFKKRWVDKKEFPIDWFIPVKLKSSLDSLNIVAGPLEKKFENFFLWMSVEGIARLPQGTKLILLTQGTKHEELNAVSLEGKKFSIPIVHRLAEVKELEESPPSSRVLSISGKFKYLGENWTFHPFLVDQEGNIKSIFWDDIFWQDATILDFNEIELKTYLFLGKIFDCGLSIFLLIWFVWSIQRLWVQKVLSTPMITCSLLAAVLPWFFAYFASLLPLVGLPYLVPQYLTISIFVTGTGILAYSFWRPEISLYKKSNLEQKVFLLFAPALLSYFTLMWWPDIGRIPLWTLGDDWTKYQIFARLIVVEGQLLEGGESVIYFPSQYRYISAFFHWLFGPSVFAQRLSDIWFTMGTAIILAHLASRFCLSVFTTFLMSFLFLSVAVGGGLTHIGRGLADHAAMFFIMFAGFLLSKEPKNYIRIVIAGCFATIGYWLHLDRIGVAGGIACLLILKSPKERAVSFVWKSFLHKVISNWKFFAVYLAILGLGLLAIILRNGFLGGHFGFVSQGHPNFADNLLWSNWYLLLTGIPWPGIPSYTLVLTLVVLPGTLLGLIALVWRPKLLTGYPLSISITLLGLFSPYLFLHIWGYPPRYSTQLLPLAVLSSGIIFDHIYEGKPISIKKRS